MLRSVRSGIGAAYGIDPDKVAFQLSSITVNEIYDKVYIEYHVGGFWYDGQDYEHSFESEGAVTEWVLEGAQRLNNSCSFDASLPTMPATTWALNTVPPTSE